MVTDCITVKRYFFFSIFPIFYIMSFFKYKGPKCNILYGALSVTQNIKKNHKLKTSNAGRNWRDLVSLTD